LTATIENKILLQITN